MPLPSKLLPNLDRVRELLDYDAASGIFTWKASRGPNKAGNEAGATNNRGYRRIMIDGAVYTAHRLAWLMGHGEDPGNSYINHINSCRVDNRLVNLELVTNRQNIQHAAAFGGLQNGLPVGVRWDERRKKYRAQIHVQGKNYNLGLYDDVETAAKAYQAALPGIEILAASGISIERLLRLRVQAATGNRLEFQSLRPLPSGVRRFGAKFQAQIQVDGGRQYLGTYATPQEAARAYQTAKLALKELAAG